MKSTLLKVLFMVFVCTQTILCFAQVKTKIFLQGIPANKASIETQAIPVKIVEAPSEFFDLQKSDNKSAEYSNQFAVDKLVDLNFLMKLEGWKKGVLLLTH